MENLGTHSDGQCRWVVINRKQVAVREAGSSYRIELRSVTLPLRELAKVPRDSDPKHRVTEPGC